MAFVWFWQQGEKPYRRFMWVSLADQTSIDMRQDTIRLPERRRILTKGGAGIIARRSFVSARLIRPVAPPKARAPYVRQ
jgi:hypothetical protein